MKLQKADSGNCLVTPFETLIFFGVKKVGGKNESLGVMTGDLLKLALSDGTECTGKFMWTDDKSDGIVIKPVEACSWGWKSAGPQRSILFKDMDDLEVIGDRGGVPDVHLNAFERAKNKSDETQN